MILMSLIITLIYLLLVVSFILGFDKIEIFKLEDLANKTKFTIVIPFRNEAEHLPELLKSIETLNYPKNLFEIVFVDDGSADASVAIIQKVLDMSQLRRNDYTEIHIISNERKTNSPKKDAITSAIKKAKYNWIITTDADCKLPEFWLDSFDEYIQKNNTICISAPVAYIKTRSLLNQFQTLDFLSLQGATIGGFGLKKPFLCNGANLAYKKSIFHAVNGFEGNNDIASGDDIFLIEKIVKKYKEQVHYLKCNQAIITTKPQATWKNLVSQRVRWASKTSAYNNWFGKLTGLIVLVMNALVIVGFVLSIIGVLNFKTIFYILFIKFNVDFFLIYKTALFFNQKYILKRYPYAFIIYPFFSVYVACVSMFSSYTWKDRAFKK